jgi:glutathione peroxidase
MGPALRLSPAALSAQRREAGAGLVSAPRVLAPGMSLNNIPLVTIDGKTTSLAQYADKVKLIVNVASRCGLTPQYEKLEQLQKEYGERGFTVLGFPSNQFLQELGSSEAIAEFCSTTYGVTFPVFEKIRVNGRNQHPLYTELTKTPDAAGKAGKIKWNFEKFVVTPSGEVHRFRPKVEPDAPEIIELIETSLPPVTAPASGEAQ